jgi:hypothetical protein
MPLEAVAGKETHGGFGVADIEGEEHGRLR